MTKEARNPKSRTEGCLRFRHSLFVIRIPSRYQEWTEHGTLCNMIPHAQTAWSIRQFDFCRADAGSAAIALAFVFHWIKTHDRTGPSRAVRETRRSPVLGPIRRGPTGGPDR